MTKQEILDRLNEIIEEEKGRKLNIDDLFMDSELDSLGIMVVLVTIDAEFEIFNGMSEDEIWASVDPSTVTMRELVNKCKLSITNI